MTTLRMVWPCLAFVLVFYITEPMPNAITICFEGPLVVLSPYPICSDVFFPPVILS